MAIAPRPDRLEEHFRDMYNNAKMYGDYEACERIKDEYERMKAMSTQQDYMDVMQQAITMGTGTMNLGSTLTGTGLGTGIVVSAGQSSNLQALQQMAAQQMAAQKPNTVLPECGVLMLRGQPLPDDWAGARITSFKRTVETIFWRLQFFSKWDSGLSIELYLSIEEYNGAEVQKMGETYTEALNQRRSG